MAGEYSRQALLTYLREAALSGRLHPAVARSRHKAAEALFAHIDEAEAADLRRLDLASLETALTDVPRGNLRPEVVALYVNRVRDALQDYADHAAPGVSSEATAPGPHAPDPTDSGSLADTAALEAVRLSFDRYRADVVPIPLSAGRVVYLHGVPADLSAEEARKIARVVEALGAVTDEEL